MSHFNVTLVDEPWLVTDKLVEVVQIAQLLRYIVEAHEPALVALLRDKLGLLLIHQVVAVVARGGHDGYVVARLVRQRALIVHQMAVESRKLVEEIRVEAHHPDHVVHVALMCIRLRINPLHLFLFTTQFTTPFIRLESTQNFKLTISFVAVMFWSFLITLRKKILI